MAKGDRSFWGFNRPSPSGFLPPPYRCETTRRTGPPARFSQRAEIGDTQHGPPSSLLIRVVERAGHPTAATIEHMGEDLCGRHILAPQQFLHRVNGVPSLEQMPCEGTQQRMSAGGFQDATGAYNRLHRPPYRGFVGMVASPHPGSWIPAERKGGKEELPGQFAPRVRVHSLQRMRQPHRRQALGPVHRMKHADTCLTSSSRRQETPQLMGSDRQRTLSGLAN
jgi:hypothetical protein